MCVTPFHTPLSVSMTTSRGDTPQKFVWKKPESSCFGGMSEDRAVCVLQNLISADKVTWQKLFSIIPAHNKLDISLQIQVLYA